MAKKNTPNTIYAISFAWQLGFLIAVPIAAFLLLGLFADRFFGTYPLFLILGIIVGIAITIYEVYNLLIPLIKKEKNA